jgi:Cu(I)/Ag(I) efflux system membrane protein CusA/SilA
MGYFIRGRITPEHRNPVNRLLQRLYRPALDLALDHARPTLLVVALVSASVLLPFSQLGSEFMPPLDEGDLLYMPTTLPGVSIDEAANMLQITDRLIRQMPEVERVFGKAGRADSATDPAPLSMLETTILLKPKSEWPDGGTTEDLIQKLDRTVRLPGLTNSWGYPIRTRIDMLSTGIRTAVGIRVTGPELAGIAALAQRLETALVDVPGTRNVFAERATGGRYLDIEVRRSEAARYGLSVAAVQRFVQGAIGGENITTVLDGRERYPVNIRYPRAFRDSLNAIASSRITTPTGEQIALGSLATLSFVDGPATIKSENGRLIGYVYIDIEGHDLGGYVEAAKRVIAVLVTVLSVLLLLYLHFRRLSHVALVALCMPLSLVGGFWLVWVLGYNLSVAVAVGFIALAGVAAEFGIVMLLYIDNAVDEFRRDGRLAPAGGLRQAIVQGALLRVRPKLMTVAVIVASLLPVMLSDGTGSDVMKRIAAPLLGGMLTAPLLSLFVIPVLYGCIPGNRR